ncbi:EamA family transporter [Halobacillus kuroshimensis]|uniref:EamA family transporter n=1 Tax=Halobacillus kuroshimensis TaxID=302481 RepID=A0ABS3DRQ8_9BACI|nr:MULTISPECIES: EamA family transporter [Halobacillus]MBN8234035.1 EamA family transporter [Halobacillus kuroshimensis]
MKYAGALFIMTAAVFWGLTGGIADVLMEKGWSAGVISFYRGAVGLICALGWFLLKPRKNRPRSKSLFGWAVLAGIGVAGNFTLYFLSIEASSIAVAAILMYTAPIFVLLSSFLLGMEKSSWLKWGCIASVLTGIVLLTGAYKSGGAAVTPAGALTGLGAGLSYALFIFGFKKSSAKGSAPATLTIAFLAFCAILFVYMDIPEAASVLTSGDLPLFILLGLIGAGLSFALYIYGIKRTAPTTASIIAMVEPVTASLFGVLILEDSLSLIQSVGMGIILITITLLSFKQADE